MSNCLKKWFAIMKVYAIFKLEMQLVSDIEKCIKGVCSSQKNKIQDTLFDTII